MIEPGNNNTLIINSYGGNMTKPNSTSTDSTKQTVEPPAYLVISPNETSVLSSEDLVADTLETMDEDSIITIHKTHLNTALDEQYYINMRDTVLEFAYKYKDDDLDNEIIIPKKDTNFNRTKRVKRKHAHKAKFSEILLALEN